MCTGLAAGSPALGRRRAPSSAGEGVAVTGAFPGGAAQVQPHRTSASDLWIRRIGGVVVAAVAAYASYVHQREFARQGGADPVSATLWPLSVDGLLLLATAGLLKHPGGSRGRRTNVMMWLSFLLGIAASLAANIAAAPELAWRSVLVAGWPPVALLLAVELLAHRPVSGTGGTAKCQEDRGGAGGGERDFGSDPLLVRARQVDARHRELHQRPVSAESLRRELRVGASRPRQLAALVRASCNGADAPRAGMDAEY
ncbi:DUF2637 domain-containing protein [Actinomycetota bacterium Odt1-20B]